MTEQTEQAEQTGFQYIDGTRRTGRGGTLERRDPSTGETGYTVDLASAEDVAEAVAAAQRAFVTWSRTTPVERSALMLAWADELDEVAEELAATESAQTGKSIRLATEFDVPGSNDNVRFFAGQARSLQAISAGTHIEGTTSMVRREPIGVVGSIRGTIRCRWPAGRSRPRVCGSTTTSPSPRRCRTVATSPPGSART